jgi:Fe-S-cluster containining protein
MVPYPNHEAARQVVPGLVDRTLAAAKKCDDFVNDAEDVVFYHCRYLQPDNRCGVHEDRPQFCRDYPDTPFVVFAPGCAFEPWAAACKSKYNDMKAEIEQLKTLKAELASLKSQQSQLNDGEAVTFTGSESDTSSLTLVLTLTDLYLASPPCSLVGPRQ